MSPFLKSCWGNPATPVGTRVWGPCHTARLEPSGCLLLPSSFIDLSLGSRMVSVGVTAAEQVWAGWGDLAIFGKLGEVSLPHKAIILLSPVMASPGSTRRGIFVLSNSLLWVWGGFLPLFFTNSYLKGIGRLWCDGDSYLYSVSKRVVTEMAQRVGAQHMLAGHLMGNVAGERLTHKPLLFLCFVHGPAGVLTYAFLVRCIAA